MEFQIPKGSTRPSPGKGGSIPIFPLLGGESSTLFPFPFPTSAPAFMIVLGNISQKSRQIHPGLSSLKNPQPFPAMNASLWIQETGKARILWEMDPGVKYRGPSLYPCCHSKDCPGHVFAPGKKGIFPSSRGCTAIPNPLEKFHFFWDNHLSPPAAAFTVVP